MYLRQFLFFFLFPGFIFCNNLDTNSVDFETEKILLNDSSAIHAVLFNKMESIFTPALYTFNLGGPSLVLNPIFDLSDWMDKSLFLFYNQNTNFKLTSNTNSNANYSYGLDDSHSIFVNFSDLVYNTHINAQFRRFSSAGIFPNSDNKGLNFVLNFSKNKSWLISRYGIYKNKYSIQENGGIKDIEGFKSTSSISVFSLETKLKSANNEFLNQGAYFNNLFLLNAINKDSANTPRFYQGISLNAAIDSKSYLFSMDGEDLDSIFFIHNYMSNEKTQDSVGCISYNFDLNYNLLDSLKRVVFSLGYLKNINNFSVLNRPELISNFNSYKFGLFNFKGSFVLDGLWKGGYNINFSELFSIKKRFVFETNYTSDHNLPGYFFMEYNSNHFNWKNTFDFVNQQKIELKILDKRFKTGIDFKLNRLSSWVYLDSLSLPNQLANAFTLSSISINNAIQTKYIRFYSLFQYQKTTSDVVRVPEFMFRNCFDYYFKIGKINFTMGYVFTYFTQFTGVAYNPALRRTFLQNHAKVGGFPLLDVFAAIKIGTAEIYAKWENVLFDTVSREFYLYPSSPISPRFIRFGLNWKFLD